MTHKSKPNNAGFTNWQENLAGEDSLPKILWSENADLKFRASNGEDDDYKREHRLAQRRSKPSARDRGYSDHKHVQRRRQNNTNHYTASRKTLQKNAANKVCNESDEERQRLKFTVKIIYRQQE